MKKVNLLFGVHCHQPVGNFDFVFEELTDRSYRPFLEVLAAHPGVQATLHYSGGLLEWLEVYRPGVLDQIRCLVQRGQVELLGGGFYEPILAVIPEADRRHQVQLLSRYLEQKFGVLPRGVWLAERVWDSAIVPALVQSGIEYVLVDDFHFICAGLLPHQLRGYYLTEEEGYPLAIFPIDAELRYLTPFQAVDKSLAYLAGLAQEGEGGCAVIVDDGEKYGGWPDTYDWVYQQGWLDQFLDALEKEADWIHTRTFSEILDSVPPRGRAYLPTASYFEMSQWSLPAERAVELGKAHQELQRDGRLEKLRPFLRGGIWKNFLVKYPESNLMHKKMLFLDQEVKKMPPSPEREKAQLSIYRAQANDAYWHGVFGGLYLPHLRQAVYRHLLVAESLIDAADSYSCRLFDFDRDGRSEIIVSTPVYSLGISPHQGGQVFDWGIKPWRANLLNTLSRRFEHYHSRDTEVTTPPPDSERVATIHDREGQADARLKEELYYDWYPRRAFIEHFFDATTSLLEFSHSSFRERGDFVLGEYSIQQLAPDGKIVEVILQREGLVSGEHRDYPLRLTKSFCFAEKHLELEYRLLNLAEETIKISFGVECNLAMPVSGGPGGCYYINGRPPAEHSFLSQGEEGGVTEVKLADKVLGGIVSLSWNRPAVLWRFPLQTVSQSEAGWEKTYQSSVLMPHWALSLDAKEEWSVRLTLAVNA